MICTSSDGGTRASIRYVVHENARLQPSRAKGHSRKPLETRDQRSNNSLTLSALDGVHADGRGAALRCSGTHGLRRAATQSLHRQPSGVGRACRVAAGGVGLDRSADLGLLLEARPAASLRHLAATPRWPADSQAHPVKSLGPAPGAASTRTNWTSARPMRRATTSNFPISDLQFATTNRSFGSYRELRCRHPTPKTTRRRRTSCAWWRSARSIRSAPS